MDHPSFFHSFCSTHGGGGSPLADGLSCLSESDGTVFALPDELGPFLNDGTPLDNRPDPSNIVDIHRTFCHTSGNKPQPGAK
jgi:hypothetical protein